MTLHGDALVARDAIVEAAVAVVARSRSDPEGAWASPEADALVEAVDTYAVLVEAIGRRAAARDTYDAIRRALAARYVLVQGAAKGACGNSFCHRTATWTSPLLAPLYCGQHGKIAHAGAITRRLLEAWARVEPGHDFYAGAPADPEVSAAIARELGVAGDVGVDVAVSA